MPTVSKITRAKLRGILEDVTILCHRVSDAECVTRCTREAWRKSVASQPVHTATCKVQCTVNRLPRNKCYYAVTVIYLYSRSAIPTSRIDARGFVFAKRNPQSWRESTLRSVFSISVKCNDHSCWFLFLRCNLMPARNAWSARSFRKRTNVRKQKTNLICVISARSQSPSRWKFFSMKICIECAMKIPRLPILYF